MFPRQTIQYHSNPSFAPTSNAEEAEVEWFYEDLQDLLELTPQKDVHNPDNHDDVITHLEPDILEREVKWALESITMNKTS